MLNLTKEEARQFVLARAPLFESGAERNPFSSPQWMLHFLHEVGRDDWNVVAPYHEGSDGSVVMMLRVMDGSRRRLSALTNYYASLYSPILGVSSDCTSAAESLVGQIADARPWFSAVDLAPLDGEAPEFGALKESFAHRGWYTKEYFCFGNWYLPCAGTTFEQYMETRDSRLRNTWTRKSKKFLAGGEARIEILSEPDQVERGMDAYEAVYAKSWKKPEPYPNFVRGWAKICARQGWLRLGLAFVGDKPIAAQFWFTANRRAYIFKLAYDEDHSKLSAGTVLGAELFRLSLDADKVHEIDYLTGDDAYKRSWMSHRRERKGIIACNPRTPEGLFLTLREAAGALRSRLSGFTSPTPGVLEPLPARDSNA